jgi:ribosomal protein L37AE/L43A
MSGDPLRDALLDDLQSLAAWLDSMIETVLLSRTHAPMNIREAADVLRAAQAALAGGVEQQPTEPERCPNCGGKTFTLTVDRTWNCDNCKVRLPSEDAAPARLEQPDQTWTADEKRDFEKAREDVLEWHATARLEDGAHAAAHVSAEQSMAQLYGLEPIGWPAGPPHPDTVRLDWMLDHYAMTRADIDAALNADLQRG